nr:MAG TPA: tail tape measure protein [Caudoviricetes sp.]
MIADFAKKASEELAKVVKSGIDYNASMESYLTNFKVMLGNEEQAAAKLSELRKMAASTPFALSDLTEGTQTLLQFGIAADDTTGVLKQLGDISLGNADKLQTLVRAYGKMSSAHKVTLENVNMMIDAGFNPLNQICEATGESMSDLYKRISDGSVSFEELQYAVQAATSEGGQFYNGMLEASQTFSGRMSTLKDNVSALTGELTSGLFAALGDLVVKLNEVVTSFLDSDEKMAQLKETIGIATSVVAAAGAAFAGYKATITAATVVTTAHAVVVRALNTAHLQVAAGAGVFKVAMAALNSVVAANPIGLAVAAFAALTAGLVTAYKTCETFRSGWNVCMNWLRSAADFAVNSVLTTLNMLMSSIRGIAAALAALPQGAAAAVDAYNSAYAASRQNYTQKRNQKNWDNSHKDLEWDDDNGWVPKGTSSSGNGSSRAGSQTAANPYPAITSGAKKASKATKQAAAEVVKSISDTTTEIDGKITRTTENITETLSNGKTQQKQVITETSRQMVDGVLKDIKTITEIDEKGKKTVKQTMETVRELAKTVTATTSGIVDGVKTTTQTVTETLTDGTETQKQVITEVYDDVVDGALVTIERVKTIAADGTTQVAEKVKESAADTFDGLWKEIQTEADNGVLGTFSDLYTAVKNQDWAGIGLWAAKTLYGGLTADQKKQIEDFALGMVGKLNEALGGMQTDLAQKAWDIGTQIVKGLTGGFSDIWQQAQGLGSTLTDIFKGLKAPLSAAATAISNGLKGGLLSSFPTIFAGVASMVGSIGAAFEGMLTAISAALNATVFGIPMGLIVAGAAVALGIAIAAICSRLGGSKKGTPSTGGGSTSGGSSGSSGISGDIDISTGTGSLEDAINNNTKALEKTNSALADMIRQAGTLVLSDNMRLGSTVAASGTAQIAAAASSYHREGDTNITQNIYSKAQTAADLQREARWEADRAKAQRR